jgi:hypothetical protein
MAGTFLVSRSNEFLGWQEIEPFLFCVILKARLKCVQNSIEGGEKSSPSFFCDILSLLLRRAQCVLILGGEKSPPFFFSETNLDSQPLLPCFIYRFGRSL